VYQLCHPDLPGEFPPLLSPQAPHHNLPQVLTELIGREAEQGEVLALLAEARLVTLVGSGGVGKTRLALAVAAELVDQYPDGVWLVELASLAEPALVPAAVAQVLGVREEPGRSLTATQIDYLKEKHLLLVVDNCEQLIAACAALASALLRGCQRLHILTTSREALKVAGERHYRVPSLPVPDLAHLPAPERLADSAAVALFLARTREQRPEFALTAQNARAVAQVCSRLDGIPLAIELAAARVGSLSVEGIAARLDDRFHLLTGGTRDALPRQRTLRATLDWSYDLLGEAEQALLDRLSVFAGGWTLAAATVVCAGEGVEDWEVLDLLDRLVNKSLVQTVEADGEARYGLLETVRQYAQARLGEAQEEQVLQERHLAWLAQHCEAIIAGWSTTDQAAVLRHLDAELENIRSTLVWGLGPNGDAVAALRLASALSRYWTTRGLVGEGRRWTARALDAAPHAPVPLGATALNRCAILAQLEADLTAAGALWETSLALFRSLGDGPGIARVVINLGLLRYDLGDDVGAVEALTEGVTLQRQLGDRSNMAVGLLNLGMVYTRQRRYPDAEDAFAEALALWQAIGDQEGISNTYLHMAHLARDQQELDGAARLYAASLRMSVRAGYRLQLAPALDGIAHVLLYWAETGKHDPVLPGLSVQLFACADSLRASTGVPRHPTSQLVYQPDLARLQLLLGTAAFTAAWRKGCDTPVLSLIHEIPAGLDGDDLLFDSPLGSGTAKKDMLPAPGCDGAAGYPAGMHCQRIAPCPTSKR
jgi:non-specific serine/threonine protein kinase